MKILFAGTSHGAPEKNAFCTSTMLLIGGKIYIIDAGAPISPILVNNDLKHSDVRGVFITHEHGDHTEGIVEFCDQVTWYYKEAHPKLFFPEEKIIPILSNWLSVMLPNNKCELEMSVYSEGVVYEDENVKISARKTDHLEYAYSFLVEAEGKRILLTGDMAYNYPDFLRITGGEEYDLVICESAHFDPGTPDEIFTQIKTKRMLVNHISPKKRHGMEAIMQKVSYDMSYAHDGLIVEL